MAPARALVLLLAVVGAGCAELGVISDGSSISVGKPNRGYLIDGARLPDKGTGYTTRDVWIKRDNRYATDEVIDLVTGVARRMHARVKDVKIVVADLSSKTGGGAFAFHRSHQSGRDVDFLYYMRDSDGKPFEPDAMHKFDARGHATDGSGLTMDVPRTWQLVKELLGAHEAVVQYIFLYEPLCQLLLEHAKQLGEPDALIAKARRALRQPGDSARHDDHMHVRVYCDPGDREYGCVDIGPMDLLAEREAEDRARTQQVALPSPSGASTTASSAAEPTLGAALEGDGKWRVAIWQGTSDDGPPPPASVAALLRAGTDRIDLRSWR